MFLRNKPRINNKKQQVDSSFLFCSLVADTARNEFNTIDSEVRELERQQRYYMA